MRKTLKTLFSFVDPASRATGAANTTQTQQAPSITPTAAATDLLKDITNIAKEQLNTKAPAKQTRTWTYDPAQQGQTNLFHTLKK